LTGKLVITKQMQWLNENKRAVVVGFKAFGLSKVALLWLASSNVLESKRSISARLVLMIWRIKRRIFTTALE
jgi:hypothetical protein